MDEMRRQYIEEKGYTVVEMWEYEWWKLYKTDVTVKEHLNESFSYKLQLHQDPLLDQTKTGALLRYLQSDINFQEHLREKMQICRQFSTIKLNVDKIMVHWVNVPSTADVNF